MKTAAQIRKANPQGQMTIESGSNNIMFTNGVVFKSASSFEKSKLWNKLLRMGYEALTVSNNYLTDEFEGLCQASQIGQNPFSCTIICSNPELNEVCK